MIPLPIILKDLKEEAANPYHYVLRCGIACVFFLLLIVFLVPGGGMLRAETGFSLLHGLLLIVNWCLGPLLSADRIAAEKRQRTLELLVISPLSFTGILWAKSLVQGLRGAVWMLAVVPVYGLLLLFGSVDPLVLAFSIGLQLCTLMMTVPLGCLVSSLFNDKILVQWGGLIFGLCLGLLFSCGQGIGLLWAIQGGGAWSVLKGGILPGEWVLEGILWTLSPAGRWSQALVQNPFMNKALFVWSYFSVVFLTSILIGSVLFLLSAHCLHRAWRIHAFSETTGAWTAPSSRSRGNSPEARRLRRRLLRNNPVLWLCSKRFHSQRYAWFLMVAILIVEMVSLSSLSLSVPRHFEIWLLVQLFLAGLWMLSLSLDSALGFRQEKESGFLEMLLVSPVSGWQIFSGKVVSIWKTYLPGCLTWLVCLYLFKPPAYLVDATYFLAVYGIGILLVTPWMGLDSSFNFRRYWMGWAATFVSILFIPGILYFIAWQTGESLIFFSITAIHAVFGVLCAFGLTLQLNERLLDRRDSKHRSRHGMRRHRKRYKKVYVRPIIDPHRHKEH